MFNVEVYLPIIHEIIIINGTNNIKHAVAKAIRLAEVGDKIERELNILADKDEITVKII